MPFTASWNGGPDTSMALGRPAREIPPKAARRASIKPGSHP